MPDLERILFTRRLLLEPLLPAHARRLFEHLQDSRLYRFHAGEPPASIEELERLYESWATRTSPDGAQTWLNYAVARTDGVYVGWVQATIAGDVATIGYDTFPEFWRRGYATEACAELVRALCHEHGISNIVAVVDTENAASIRLLEGLGFRHVWTGRSADMPGRQDRRYEMHAPKHD